MTTNTTGIIKVRKTANYVQIANDAIQKTLERADSIGILAYLISLPETWVIQKTQLMRKFGRATVTHAFKELEQKGFLISIKYRSGSKNLWTYAISDVQFTREEVHEIIINADFEALEVQNMHEIDLETCTKIREEIKQKSENVDIPTVDDVHENDNMHLSSVENQHLNLNSSKTTPTKEIVNKKISNKKTLVKKTTSSSQDQVDKPLNKRTIEARSKIDEELKEKYPGLPFEEIKEQLLQDDSLVLHTSRQYKAMLNYRLKNYRPNTKKPYKRKIEAVPDWLNKRDEQQPKEVKQSNNETIDFEAERAKVLAKLNG